MKVKLTLLREYGEVAVEADSLDELVNSLREFPEWSDVIDGMVARRFSADEEGILAGAVEPTKDGPVITLAKEKLTSKEAIGILLYAMDREGAKPQEVGRLLSLSGFVSLGYGARLSELKREGLVHKGDDDLYRLTARGKRWVEGVVQS